MSLCARSRERSMLLAGPCAALLHPEFIELLAFGSDSAKPARSCPTQQWSRTSL